MVKSRHIALPSSSFYHSYVLIPSWFIVFTWLILPWFVLFTWFAREYYTLLVFYFTNYTFLVSFVDSCFSDLLIWKYPQASVLYSLPFLSLPLFFSYFYTHLVILSSPIFLSSILC